MEGFAVIGTEFAGAQWVWPLNQCDLGVNVYVQFRRDFNLSSVPSRAKMFITADQSYVLYVNGQYVCRGPARGFQTSWPYDEVDIAPHLRRGANWISILAYNAGVSTFQYVHQASAGVLCRTKIGKLEIVSGDTWVCRVAPGTDRATGRLSVQQNYQECVDKRLNDNAWITSARFPRNRWRKPRTAPLGSMPWHGLEARGIAMLTDDIEPYRNVAAVGGGKCDDQWRESQDIFRPIYKEVKSGTWKRQSQDATSVELPPSGDGRFESATFDFATHTVGTLNVEITGAQGGETVDFHFCEGLNANGSPMVGTPPGEGSAVSLACRMILKKGRNSHEFFQMIGHRFVTTIARETSTPLKITLTNRQTIYDLDVAGSFSTDDNLINDIYGICARTQLICMLDAYVDTPWREQAQWWGDARVQARNTFHLSDDTRLLERGIRCIARQGVPNGLTYGHAPTRAHGCILPDFTLIWIITIWDLYFQTGDTSMFVEQLPRIERALNYFCTEGMDEKTGLLRYDERYWLFLDWCDMPKQGVPALYNLWYVYTLKKLIELAKAANMPDKAREFKRVYDRHAKLVVKHYWIERKGLFRDNLPGRATLANRCSVHTQTLAMMIGLKKPHHHNMITSRLLPFLLGEKIDSALPSSYWVTYVYDIMEGAGYGLAVLNHIKKHWSKMVPFGGTWEIFMYPGDSSQNRWSRGVHSMTHAWAAHPIYHLARTIGGVRQVAPRWDEIRYCPVIDGSGVGEMELVIPTPHGSIVSRREVIDGEIEFSIECPDTIRVRAGND